MESDNLNLQNTIIRYLVITYIFTFFFWGGGLEEKPQSLRQTLHGLFCHFQNFPSLDSNG